MDEIFLRQVPLFNSQPSRQWLLNVMRGGSTLSLDC